MSKVEAPGAGSTVCSCRTVRSSPVLGLQEVHSATKTVHGPLKLYFCTECVCNRLLHMQLHSRDMPINPLTAEFL